MSTPARYVTKPVTVWALQWLGDNLRAVQDFCLPASPFYAPAVITADPMTTRLAVLRVRVRDEVADERYPSLAPNYKEIDVPLGAWLIARVNDGLRDVLIVTDARFQTMFGTHTHTQQAPRGRALIVREPAADGDGATIDREETT